MPRNPILDQAADGPVYVSLVPLANPVPRSSFVIESGFSLQDNPNIHRLSQTVLQLAVVNFVATIVLELTLLIVGLLQGSFVDIAAFVFWVFFSYYVLWIGVEGVKSRNKRCCRLLCDCGYLQMFLHIYIILACLRAGALIVSLIDPRPLQIAINLFFLLLNSLAAEYARRLGALLDDANEPTTFQLEARVPTDLEAAIAGGLPDREHDDDDDDDNNKYPRDAVGETTTR